MSKVNSKTAPATEQPATLNTGVTLASQYNWLKDKTDEDTGEVTQVQRFKYMQGMPREYRYDAKKGQVLLGAETSVGKTFKIQPIAWCFFNDALFGQKENFWVEVFFLDPQNCVACIMFAGSSAVELQKIAEPLFYEDKGLNQVVIEVYSSEHTNSKISPPVKYTIARFDRFTDADTELVKEMKAFVKEHKVYRASTVQDSRQVVASKFWFDPRTAATQELEEAGSYEEVDEPQGEVVSLDKDGNKLPF